MGSLFQIVYTSNASKSLGRTDLLELLEGSVRRNQRAGVTGLLLYKDGHFMQVLEGEEPVLIPLFARICRDPRHHHVIPIIHEPIPQRHFPDSAMAFRDLNAADLRDRPGYSEFLNTPLNGDSLVTDIPRCKRLLLLFKQDLH